jgi:hypothetical protein
MSQHDYEYLLMTLYMLFVLQENGVVKEGCGSSLPLRWGLSRPWLVDYNLDSLDWLHVLFKDYLSQ